MSSNIFILGLVGLAIIYLAEGVSSPEVQVYLRHPTGKGKENVIQCYASKFHPPDIKATLFKNGQVMTNAEVKDMGFDRDWTFRYLTYATFTPAPGDKMECHVSHQGIVKKYTLEQQF